jgi:SPP1 gp7 family putative phage head morphogenesis protein
MSIIDKLEFEVRKFMNHQLKIEGKIKNDIIKVLEEARKDIELVFRSTSDVNIQTLKSIIDSRIKPIVDNNFSMIESILNNAIDNMYETGIDNGGKLLEVAKRNIEPINKEEIKRNNTEILAALLLFGKTLTINMRDNLTSDLNKDLTNIYIESKNMDNKNVNKTPTLNTILEGTFIAKYINSTFKKYKNRATTVVQTELIRALNHGKVARYKKERDIKVKFIAIHDGHTCRVCESVSIGGNDGIYNIDSVPEPPLHPNCRCVLIPYSENW